MVHGRSGPHPSFRKAYRSHAFSAPTHVSRGRRSCSFKSCLVRLHPLLEGWRDANVQGLRGKPQNVADSIVSRCDMRRRWGHICIEPTQRARLERHGYQGSRCLLKSSRQALCTQRYVPSACSK